MHVMTTSRLQHVEGDLGDRRSDWRFAANEPLNYADPTGLYQQGHPLQGGSRAFDNAIRGIVNNPRPAPQVAARDSVFSAVGRVAGSFAANALSNPIVNTTLGVLGAAAYGPVWDKLGEPGHHPVPQAVTRNLNSRLTPDAVDVFARATSGALPYAHGSDPWKGISHQKYSDSVESLLRSYSEGGKLTEGQARVFVGYIEEGKIAKDAALKSAIKANKDAVSAVNTWRAGFIKGAAEASTALQAATDLKIELSNAQVKAIAQQRVNGSVSSRMQQHLDSQNVRLVEQHLSKLAQAGRLGKYAAGALKKAAPALAIMSAANAYANGSRNGHRGLLGAGDQTIADLMSADLAENYVLRPGITNGVNYVEQNLGGGIPNQRVRRGGFDAAGRPIDNR